MHTPTLTTFLLTLLTTLCLADFQIYSGQDLYNDGLGDSYQNYGWLFFPGEPDCDDVNNAPFEADTDDASSAGVRAQVADKSVSIADWDIQELEWNTDMGHFTIYEDASYQITPADGSPLIGSCVRDSGDDFSCTFGATDNFTGVRTFICTSPLTAPGF